MMFSSTSLRPEDGISRYANTGGGLILEISVPQGTKGGLTELVYPRGKELELTLARNTTFEITGVQTDGAGMLRVQLKVTSQP